MSNDNLESKLENQGTNWILNEFGKIMIPGAIVSQLRHNILRWDKNHDNKLFNKKEKTYLYSLALAGETIKLGNYYLAYDIGKTLYDIYTSL